MNTIAPSFEAYAFASDTSKKCMKTRQVARAREREKEFQ